ncbi:MBL fold metallo-hydrolase [Candidatus Nomurabacteria bacterium RIFCSPHIGHO2_01_FULL_43_16]|nr:MAG: MBL fold metallo-hydrolase [Candidatus Nomurabacteria bacterium RIFCSPHIGHO2_01_FULL_43_16]OGI97113.1 MAG: MBL fold metallo-hydrolase [Candidatus Nomurabacteria bacterium RIFCSPLOWO2_01_FULL_43_15]
MAKKTILLIIVIVGLVLINKMSNNEDKKDMAGEVGIDPISHASLILNWAGKAIYSDPVGGAELYQGKPAADLILLTDIHQDHFDPERLKALAKEEAVIVAPQAVMDELPEALAGKTSVMNNGGAKEYFGFKVEAIPMYNLPGGETLYHPKGRGNGYVLEKDGTRVYISGDSAGIPEMKNLKNIDIAFMAMNLPYTMGVEEAAEAVLAFAPKTVYPYHYRTPGGFSDVAKFKTLVNDKNPNIQVVLADWY